MLLDGMQSEKERVRSVIEELETEIVKFHEDPSKDTGALSVMQPFIEPIHFHVYASIVLHSNVCATL